MREGGYFRMHSPVCRSSKAQRSRIHAWTRPLENDPTDRTTTSPAIRFDQDVSCRARAPQQVPSRATSLASLPASCPRKRDRERCKTPRHNYHTGGCPSLETPLLSHGSGPFLSLACVPC